MNDIFSNDDFGGGYDPFQSTEAAADDNAAAVDNGSTDAAALPVSTDEGATAPVQDATETGTQQPNAPTEGDQSSQAAQPNDVEIAKMEQEAEAVLADPKTPKWFKNAVENVYKPKLDTLGQQVQKYSAFGTPEELTEKIGLMSKLGEVRQDPNTGMPVKTTEGFVQALREQNPELTLQLMNDLAQMPSPTGEGTVIQALFNQMGIDPNRLTDIQKFAQNGYQLQASQYDAPDPADLAMIPEHLQATFAKLSPEVRDSLMSDIDSVRNHNLEAHKFRIESQEREAAATQTREEQEAAQLQQQQAQFKQQVDSKGAENFEKVGAAVLDSFVESLAKNAGMSALDSNMIATTVLTSFEPTLAGQRAQAALKDAGIEIDATVQPTINELDQVAKFIAYYELINDQANLQVQVNRQVELQNKLIAKGSKIVAALAVKRNGSVMTPARQVSNQLANTVNNNRYATAPNGVPHTGGQAPPADRNFSDQSYEEAIAADPFFSRR